MGLLRYSSCATTAGCQACQSEESIFFLPENKHRYYRVSYQDEELYCSTVNFVFIGVALILQNNTFFNDSSSDCIEGDMYKERKKERKKLILCPCCCFCQKLHTLFNLSDVLSHHQEGCSRTLRDDQLQDEVSVILLWAKCK